MATNNLIVLILVVVLLIQPVSLAMSNICSTFCATNSCTDWSMYGCNNQCYNGWTYSTMYGTCDFTVASQMAVMDYSDDAGGSISVIPNPMSPGCTFSGVGAGTPYYGAYKASQTVNATLGIGTYMPYYSFDVYLDLILVDVNGNDQWSDPSGSKLKMSAKLSETGQNLTQQISIGGGGGGGGNSISSGNVIVQSNSYCGDTNKNDNYYRIIFKSFTYNVTGSMFTMEFNFNNQKPNAIWYFREVIFVARICNIYCLSCYNSAITNCYSCDVEQGYMLSNTTCATSCLPGYGYTFDPSLCVLCDKQCSVCFGVYDNCTACKSSSPYTSYLYYNSTLAYSQCVNPCPSPYFANTSARTCDLCNANCTVCVGSSTYCQECVIGYGYYNHYCFMPCPTGFYYTNGTNNCTLCPLVCQQCLNSTQCTVCTTSGPNTAYLLGSTCYTTCPAGNYSYNDSGVNLCYPCSLTCATCTGDPSPCQSCNNGSFLYIDVCQSTCPTGYIAYVPLNKCLDCNIYCVSLSIKMWFPTVTNSLLYIDMTYSQPLDFNTFNYQTFQTISINNNDISNFIISYQITGTKSYRITVQPKGFIFLYNETVTVTTQTQPDTLDTSTNGLPFKVTTYSQTATTSWFLMNAPDMSDLETSIINGVGSINSVLQTATTSPFIAQIKKSGAFAALLSGAHLTSTTLFVNSVPPQNMYEGARFWGLSTFYDVPPWEQSSSIPNNFFGLQTHNLTKNQRRLFDMTSIDWRFQRTGMSSFFIYDVYIPLLLIAIIWILALVALGLRRWYQFKFKPYQAKYFTALHKIHEFAVIYVTMAMILQWLYFDAASTERWISLLMCLAFTLYFLAYHLYVYYEMIRYPEAIIGNQRYQFYVTRYSTFLKNLRFQQYDMKEEWSPKHWFRPYNYHILSYYKKFCMIISLPLFYSSPQWEACILIFLQLLQIIRFCVTKPYYARWRNIFRFCLQFIALIMFVAVFANTFILQQIVLNDPNTVSMYITVFYNLGWLGFVCVWVFNIGFIVLCIIDVCLGFKKTNRDMMDEARRVYYYDKINDYEKEYEQVPLGLMNRWVKMGNLNNRDQQSLPDINVRIQYYKLVRHKQYFDVEILKTVQLFMNTDFNFHKENNTTPGKQIRKRCKLTKEVSASLYQLINSLYSKHSKKDTESMVIKTFTHVEQKQFQAGDRVPLLPEKMFQKIQLQNCQGDKQAIKLKQKIKGFPLNAHQLESI